MGSSNSLSTSALSQLLAPITFNGSSKFSSDFQQVLTRAVGIQSLPLQGMESELSTLQQQQSDMTGLQRTFTSLQTAIQGIDSSVGTLSATSSNPTAVTASASSTATPGTYSIQVVQVGSPTTTLSGAGSPVVTDPTTGNISSSSNFTLTVNGNTYNINPSGSSLDSLASAINASGAGVQATVINVGSNSSPDYRLSIASNSLGTNTIQLSDGTNNSMLSQLAPGSPAQYELNGGSTVFNSNSSQLTLAPGLTVNLLQSTTSPVTISVADNTNGLSNALGNFVTAYNAAVDALGAQHGQNAGSLLGDSTVLALGQTLTSITEYTGGTSGLTSLADLGLTLDPTSGHLSFDPSALATADPSTIQQFLGGISSGGFLQSANNALTFAADPTTGAIQSSLTSLQNSINSENDQISQQTDQINTFQTNLQTQLANADASIAVLEQQETYFTNLFATMYQPSTSSTGSTSTAG